ncbi:MAG: outer membrane protein assembly factor BamA [Deltaproteobacteria bacterium]|nr:outer membrane protein assembly factor BamA [Deltaproteobacteria bacterium]
MDSRRHIRTALFLTLAFCSALTLELSWGQEEETAPSGEGMRVIKIQVSGNRQIESAVIHGKIKTKTGDLYSSQSVRDDIESIYDLGFFDTIQADLRKTQRGAVLTYIVSEHPRINNIDFRGNDDIKTKDLEGALGIAKYQLLDWSKLLVAREKLIELYESKGFYLAEVTYEVVSLKEKPGEVDVIFTISEGGKVKIRAIHFLGNRVFTDEELKGVMITSEYNLFSFLTGRGYYQQAAFERDIQVLTFHYYKHGYVQIQVSTPQIYLSPDKKWIYITLNVREGEQFSVGKVDFTGELLWTREELASGLKLKPGDTFDSQKLSEDVLHLTNRFKDEGYAFANVVPQTPLHPDERLIDLVFEFEKGPKVYIGKINIVGNDRTRDKVIRREMKIHEGDLYNETNLQKSIDNIRRLGYFSEVSYTKPQGKSLNELDLDIQIKERTTGTLQLSAGFSTLEKFVGRVDLSQNNLFGLGQVVSLSAYFSSLTQQFDFSFTEPHLVDTDWLLGLEAYNRKRETVTFTEKTFGGGFSFGHPIHWEELRLAAGYKWENVDLDIPDPVNIPLIDPDTNNGITSSLYGTLSWDSRNDRFAPTSGMYHSLYNEFAGLGGDKHFLKHIGMTQWYFPMVWGTVLRLRGVAGTTFGLAGKDVPNNERFILGGPRTLRGFRPYSLGPTKTNSKGEAIVVGGLKELFANLEYEIPIVPTAGIRGVLFYDIGNAFNDERDVKSFRSDWGFGFRWFSPLGPLSFEFGYPIDKRPGEESPVFNFAIVPPF